MWAILIPEARMRTADDSARTPDMSAADRLRAVARILAIGLNRLRNRAVDPPTDAPQILSDSGRNDLEPVGENPLTVHTG